MRSSCKLQAQTFSGKIVLALAIRFSNYLLSLCKVTVKCFLFRTIFSCQPLCTTVTFMRNTIKFILITLFISIQFGCSDKGSDENIPTALNDKHKLKEPINKLGCEIESKDLTRIKTITTDKGYNSILSWSDSLQNISFINTLSKDLKYYNVAKINQWNDSMFALSLGDLDEVIGATHGYIVLKRINNRLRIDEFRGGK